MAQDAPSRHLDQFMVRFPDGIRDRLQDEAKAHNRSMNAEIVWRIERSFEAGVASLDGQIAALIQKHVEAEVQRRLRAIASQIGGAS